MNLYDSIVCIVYGLDWHLSPLMINVPSVSHLIVIGADLRVGVALQEKQLSFNDDLKMAAKGFTNGTVW